MNDLYGLLKKGYDQTLRNMQQNSRAGITYGEDPTTHETTTINPSVDLNRHKLSSDHDGRYYTKAEVDALILEASKTYEPVVFEGELVFFNGDIVMTEVFYG